MEFCKGDGGYTETCLGDVLEVGADVSEIDERHCAFLFRVFCELNGSRFGWDSRWFHFSFDMVWRWFGGWIGWRCGRVGSALR